ncbi:MAG: hypothetical protein JW776_10965 [Candidatus Lokiarchaeota archaeon]|nr:hypothetical protein [Candidatus Lokiarchaeota archaeon]
MNSRKQLNENAFSEYGLNTEKQRAKLQRWGKFLIYSGWFVTGIAAICILIITITLGSRFNWVLFGILMGVLVSGQALRVIGRMMKKKSQQKIPFSGKKLIDIKEQREKEVVEYFERNKDIASKIMQMDELAKRGQFKDAYNLATKLAKLDIPPPIRDFLHVRRNVYAKQGKSK